MALVAIDEGNGEMLGAVRLLADANFDRGEYGIMVRSDLKGAGIGWRLMEALIAVAHWLGLNVIEGQVLRANRTIDRKRVVSGTSVSVRVDPGGPRYLQKNNQS